MEIDNWMDREGSRYEIVRAPWNVNGELCEQCEPDTPATLELRSWDPSGDFMGSQYLCDEHLAALRKDRGEYPRAFADRYVNLGAAL